MIEQLGGIEFVDYLQSINSPCITWSREEPPVVLFNIDRIDDDQFDRFFAEEMFHAVGLRSPIEIPILMYQDSNSAMQTGLGAMEKMVSYLVGRTVGFEEESFEELLDELLTSCPSNMIAEMCLTGDCMAFLEWSEDQFPDIEKWEGMDVGTQILVFASLLHQREIMPEESEFSEQLDEYIKEFMLRFGIN